MLSEDSVLLRHLPRLVGGFGTVPALEHTHPEGLPKLLQVNGRVKAWALRHRIWLSCASVTVVSRMISWGGSKGCRGWTGGQELGLETRKSHKAGAGRTRPHEGSPRSLKLLSPGGGMMADSGFSLFPLSLSPFFWKINFTEHNYFQCHQRNSSPVVDSYGVFLSVLL